jgi:predicted ATP-binding protein involved in virulence
MYLESFTIEGIKCFEKALFRFPTHRDGGHAGWHVLLGANATGKTTVLQSIAVSLIGPTAWTQLHAPVGWARQRKRDDRGVLHATITKGPRDVADRAQKGPFQSRVYVTPDASIEVDRETYDAPQFVLGAWHKTEILKSVYAVKRRGWFACGYGPFRRLSGGSSEATASLSQPRQFRVASLFRESVALTQCEPWLRELHHRAHDDDNPDHKRDWGTFEAVVAVINSLLPGAVKLDRVSSAGVQFTTAGKRKVSLAELSDGYRSFLALVVDVLRHLADAGELSRQIAETIVDGRKWKQVTAEGVVLIDEVDAHLHPSWQRSIGAMLQTVFPRMQFIVSSHSPFVAQAASAGGIFVLRPGADGSSVEVTQPIDSVRGWRADAILTSDLFGLDDTVDLDTSALVKEYRALSSQRSFGKLTKSEQQRLDSLEAKLSRSLTAPGESIDEFRRRVDTEAFIQRTLSALEKTS